MTRLAIPITVIQFPIVADNSSLFLAPKYWDTMILTPTLIPTKRTISRFMIGPALPTAASALSPTYFPTTTLSTAEYVCCAIFPRSIGDRKNCDLLPRCPTCHVYRCKNFFYDIHNFPLRKNTLFFYHNISVLSCKLVEPFFPKMLSFTHPQSPLFYLLHHSRSEAIALFLTIECTFRKHSIVRNKKTSEMLRSPHF